VQPLEATGLNKEEADMSKKIEDRLTKNKELANLISQLKGIGGDPPTDVKPKVRKSQRKKESASSVIKEFADIFAKDGPTGSEVQSLEDYVSGYGNPIGTGPADVSFGPYHEGAGYSVFKKGGRLKKAKKKAPRKRAALRGQRSELRGS